MGGVGASGTGWGHRAGHGGWAHTDQGGTGPCPSVTDTQVASPPPRDGFPVTSKWGWVVGCRGRGRPRDQSAAGGVSGPTGHLPALPGHAQRVKAALRAKGRARGARPPAASLPGMATPSGPATPGLASTGGHRAGTALPRLHHGHPNTARGRSFGWSTGTRPTHKHLPSTLEQPWDLPVTPHEDTVSSPWPPAVPGTVQAAHRPPSSHSPRKTLRFFVLFVFLLILPQHIFPLVFRESGRKGRKEGGRG